LSEEDFKLIIFFLKYRSSKKISLKQSFFII